MFKLKLKHVNFCALGLNNYFSSEEQIETFQISCHFLLSTIFPEI